MAAGIADEAGKRELVKANQAHAEKAARRFGERPGPIAGTGFRNSTIVLATGLTAHGSGRKRLFCLDLVKTVANRIECQKR